MAHRRLWILIAAAGLTLIVAWMAVARSHLGSRRIVAELPWPRLVRPGTPVIVSGLAVGRVRTVECRDSAAVVVLALEHPELSLTRAHRARRVQLGAFGDDAVELVAPAHAAPKLEATDTLAGLAPKTPTSADSMLARQLSALGWRVANRTEAPCRPTTR